MTMYMDTSSKDYRYDPVKERWPHKEHEQSKDHFGQGQIIFNAWFDKEVKSGKYK